jgi:hypothetical protein
MKVYPLAPRVPEFHLTSVMNVGSSVIRSIFKVLPPSIPPRHFSVT